MPKQTIYISYSRDNTEFVLNLAKMLREAGAIIWLDQLDIKAGDNWDSEIQTALQNSETFLVILSKDSVASNNVMDEVGYALGANKKVVPVLIEDCEIPFRLRRRQIVDFTKDRQKGIEGLIEALELKADVAEKLSDVSNRSTMTANLDAMLDGKWDKVDKADVKSTTSTGAFPNERPPSTGKRWKWKWPKMGMLKTNDYKPARTAGSPKASKDSALPLELGKLQQENNKEVSVNVYAPHNFERGKSQFIQVWMFLPKHENKVEEKARSIDDEASRLGFENLLVPIEHGTEIMLSLSSPDLHYQEQKSFKWLGEISNKNFSVEIPGTFRNDKIIFTLEVYLDKMIVGEITFMIKASNKFIKSAKAIIGKDDNASKPIGDKATRFKKAFISYASDDRIEVLGRVQGIDATKVFDIFQDILELEAGERWENRLYKEIDKCDVFFLFWSEAASQSPWVLKELEYAIKLKQGDQEYPPKIQPVIIPPVVMPPKQLGHLHFNDKLVQFIIAEEQIRKSQEKV